MGNGISKQDTLSIEHMTEIVDLTYTVVRTSGVKESGWSIMRHNKFIETNAPTWINCHVIKLRDEWRIFMHNNNTDPNLYACGWRKISTITPTHLMEDEYAISKWILDLINSLDELEKGRASV